MLSIGSVSDSGSELTQMLQRLANQRTNTTEATGTTESSSNGSRRAYFDAKFLEAAVAAGLDSSEAESVQSEIEAAIAEARKNAGNATDQGQAVRDAVDGVLQKHGVDLDKFREELRSSIGGMGQMPPPGPPPGQSGNIESKITDAAVAAGLDPSEAAGLQEEIKTTVANLLKNKDSSTDPRQAIQDAIDKLLKSHGVDLEEFKSELSSTMSSSQQAVPLLDEQA